MSPPSAEPRKAIPLSHYFGGGTAFDLGLTRQDALHAIIDIFLKSQQTPLQVDLPAVLRQISKYFSKSLDQTQSGKLELDVGKHDWQLWTKYKKALSDFQSGHIRDLKTKIIETYESMNRVTANEPYILVDRDYSSLAIQIDGLTPQPPVGVDLQYWYSITPHVFTVSESRRAIDKINRLHQEYQWATHGQGGWATKGLWLFVWRMLKKTWLFHCLEGHSFPRAVAGAVSQLEKPFLDEHTASFNRMNQTSEILHHDLAQKLVLDFGFRCYQTFSARQQGDFAKSAKLDNSSKECLHAFIHGKAHLTDEVVHALRNTAARYYAQHTEELKQLDEHAIVLPDAGESADRAEADPRDRNVFPMPVALARKSAYDYVWFDMPDTRAREVAESHRIQRDMTESGIQSDGVRTSELINIPPRHARRPNQISRWKTFSPFIGPISATWRLAKYWIRGNNLSRPTPKIPKRIARRQLPKRSESHAKQSAPPTTPLSPVRDNARRVSKPSPSTRFPVVKLRGGGPKTSPAWQKSWSREQGRLVADLARRLGIDQPTTDQANFLVGSYLTASQWNVKAAEKLWKEKAIPPEDMRYHVQRFDGANHPMFASLAEPRRRQLHLLMAALDGEHINTLEDDKILSALEAQDWRWEAALTDLRGERHAGKFQAQPSLAGSDAPDESHFLSSFVAEDPQEGQNEAGHVKDEADGKSLQSQNNGSRSSRLSKDSTGENDLNGRTSSSKSPSRRGEKSGENGNEGALPSCSPVDMRSKPSERNKGPRTPSNQSQVDNQPKRRTHAGSQAHAIDSCPIDDLSEETLQLPPHPSSSPAQEAITRKLAKQTQQEQQGEGAGEIGPDQDFELYDENGASPAKSGLEDRIGGMGSDPEHRPSASGSFLDKENSRVLQEIVEEPVVCHPCPHYEGQYHHKCNNYKCKLGVMVTESGEIHESIEDREPAELLFESGSSPSARYGLLTLLDRDIHAVTTREANGAKLNEIKLHARLQRILNVAATWPSGTDYKPLIEGRVLWEQFLLPEPIQPNGPLSYEAFRRCHGRWHGARSPVAKETELKLVREYLMALVEYHYARNSPDRCANSSDDAMKVETFRSFPYYHREALKLKRELNALADLFAEVDGFSGMEHRRSSHAEHHDFFRDAYWGLLALRRGLGQVIPDAECDDAPRWADYGAQGLAPSEELYDLVKVAVAAVDPLVEFFDSGDTEVDVDQSVEYLHSTIDHLRGVLYSRPNRITPPSKRCQTPPNRLLAQHRAVQRKSPGQFQTPPNAKRKADNGDDDDEDDSAKVLNAKKPRLASSRPAPAPHSDPARESVLGSSDKENHPVMESIEKDDSGEAEKDEVEEEEEQQEGEDVDEVQGEVDQTTIQVKPAVRPAVKPKSTPKSKTAPKAKSKPAPKAKPARKLPSAQDYSNFMYLDEIKDEIKYRGLAVNGKMVKANLIKHLVEADEAGKTGLGVMRSWRKMNDKKANEGRRPNIYDLPSATEVKKKFGKRLV